MIYLSVINRSLSLLGCNTFTNGDSSYAINRCGRHPTVHNTCVIVSLYSSDIDECSEGTHNCEQSCIDNAGSFSCSCHSGYALLADRRSCTSLTDCGGRMTATSGSFQTPGWPHSYPQAKFQCEWIVELPDPDAEIEFTIDNFAYGINGRSPCKKDYIEFYETTSRSTGAMYKLCRFDNPGFIIAKSSQARIMFASTVNSHRPRS